MLRGSGRRSRTTFERAYGRTLNVYGEGEVAPLSDGSRCSVTTSGAASGSSSVIWLGINGKMTIDTQPISRSQKAAPPRHLMTPAANTKKPTMVSNSSASRGGPASRAAIHSTNARTEPPASSALTRTTFCRFCGCFLIQGL